MAFFGTPHRCRSTSDGESALLSLQFVPYHHFIFVTETSDMDLQNVVTGPIKMAFHVTNDVQ